MSYLLDAPPDVGGAHHLPFPCTPAQLVENIRGKVSSDVLKSLKSAVRTACKCHKKNPDKWMLASAKELVDGILAVHPIQAEIKPSYWRVTSSRVMSVLRHNGVEFLSGHCKTDLPEADAYLVAEARQLNEPRTRSLMPFLRDRMAMGLGIRDMSQADFVEYCQRVDEFSQRKNKIGTKQGVRRDWNYFAKHIDGWPKLLFVMESKREDYILPEDEMPPAVAAFDAKINVPLRGNRKYAKRRRRLSPSTIESREYLFRRIISAAIRGGIKCERLQTIADVCNLEVLETAYNYILDRIEKKRKCQVEGTGDVSRMAGLMLAVAEQWAGVTGDELAAHAQLRADFEHIQHGMAEKNQRVITKFASDKAIAEFLKTPARIMALYREVQDPSLHQCVEMELAAAMALFTRVLVRMENMKRIVVDTHLVDHGWGADRKVLLIFGAEEVKNEEYLETLLSPRVVAIVDQYMEKAWPKLRRGGSKFLFPGYGGNHKSASCFGTQLASFVYRHTGVRVTPHQFRHLCGYIHLRRHPGDYATVQKMLGHRRIETTIKFYTGTMDRTAAFEKYDAGLEERIERAEQYDRVQRKLRVT